MTLQVLTPLCAQSSKQRQKDQLIFKQVQALEESSGGNAAAEFLLGDSYEHDRGVPQDYAAAASWYRKAADRGNAEAQYNLGLMHANGQGIPQDHVSAHMWWKLSAARGDKDAAKNLDMVAAKMTPAQIAEAQRLAREWKPRQK